MACILIFVLLVSCAPAASGQQAQESISNEKTTSIAWSTDTDCSVCHAGEGESLANQKSGASKHAGQDCLSCHSDTSELGSIHSGELSVDNMPKRLKKTEVSNAVCLSCHYETLEKLAEATPDLSVVDKNGTMRNPHAMMLQENHSDLECASCHSMHVDDTTDERALTTCIGCHHEEVFECGTCHD